MAGVAAVKGEQSIIPLQHLHGHRGETPVAVNATE